MTEKSTLLFFQADAELERRPHILQAGNQGAVSKHSGEILWNSQVSSLKKKKKAAEAIVHSSITQGKWVGGGHLVSSVSQKQRTGPCATSDKFAAWLHCFFFLLANRRMFALGKRADWIGSREERRRRGLFLRAGRRFICR